MGAGSSSLLLNKRELQAAEREPTLLMDRILNFILTGIGEKDIFKMQDRTTCQKYLLVSVEQLKTLFTELQLYPVQGEGGKILFRKIADLTNPAAAAAKEQLDSNCLAIGYFYVRILQIYLALALTILDDPVIGAMSGPQAAPPGFQRGGGSEFNFDVMTTFDDHKFQNLTDEPKSLGGGPGRYSIRPSNDSKGEYMSVRIQAAQDKESGRFSNKVGLVFGYKQDSAAIAGIPMYEREQRRGPEETVARYLIKFEEGTGNSLNHIIISSIIYPTKKISYQGRRYDILREVFKIPITDDYKLKVPYKVGAYKTLSPYITTFLRQILQEFDNGNITSFTNYAKFLSNRRYPELDVGDRRVSEQEYRWDQPAAAPQLRAASTQAALNFDSALIALRKQVRPLAHCVARAHQLLAIDTMAGAKEARTYICNKSFMPDRAQVPDGGSITRIEGVKALNLLFQVLNRTKIGLSARSEAGLRVALQMFAQTFSDRAVPDSMDKIIAKAPARCGGRSGPATLVGKQDIQAAKAGVDSLWAYQRKHLVAVANMFKLLFNVSRDGAVLGFNPRILAGGIPYVEELAEKARIVLVDYYTNCEAIYQDTVNKFNNVRIDLGQGQR